MPASRPTEAPALRGPAGEVVFPETLRDEAVYTPNRAAPPSDPTPERRTVYVFLMGAVALPVGWFVLRRRKPAPAPISAAAYEEAYELGRADERAAAEHGRPAARVIPFRPRNGERPPAG
ncbi:hypothetical protein [Micromonospora sp. NPDC023956]|uniref:hypothetical protein n=1 Tax=Micromonospora sp. NPDC023956 TaxID=3155722 RepID=UPI003406FDD9